MLDREARRRDGCTVKLRTSQHLAGDAHHFLLHERKLVAFSDDLPPFVNLLVNVDLDRANVRATAVECGGKGKVAVFADIECGIDDDADRTGVGRAVAEAPT